MPYETDYRKWQHQAGQSLVPIKNVLVGFRFKGLCSLLILHVFVCCLFFALPLKETAVCLPWTQFAPNHFPPYITNFYLIRSHIEYMSLMRMCFTFRTLEGSLPWSATSTNRFILFTKSGQHQCGCHTFWQTGLDEWGVYIYICVCGCVGSSMQAYIPKDG